jgi:DMSO/TMAO reductase YedYZ molybdopterin-dependent catalytic subunit
MTYVIFIGLVMLRRKQFFLELLLVGLIISVVLTSSTVQILAETTNETKTLETVEVSEYEGEDLSTINSFRENSIKGPQYIDLQNYIFSVTGLVKNKLEYTYDDVLSSYPSFKKVVTLHCIEGWSVTILWEGIKIEDILADAQINPEANTVIFYAYDGYSTSLPLNYIIDNNIIIAYKMNNVTLPPERGYPFQLVAENKLGYKWIKWITTIEVSDNPDYRGFWESRGYSNNADLDGEIIPLDININPAIPEFTSWIIIPLFVTATAVVIIYRKRLTQKKSVLVPN